MLSIPNLTPQEPQKKRGIFADFTDYLNPANPKGRTVWENVFNTLGQNQTQASSPWGDYFKTLQPQQNQGWGAVGGLAGTIGAKLLTNGLFKKKNPAIPTSINDIED